MKQLFKQLILIIIALILGLIINQLLFTDYLLTYIYVPQGYMSIYFNLSWLGLALILYSFLHYIISGYLPVAVFTILVICYWILMIGLLFFKTKNTQGINLDFITYMRYALFDKMTMLIAVLNIIMFMPLGMHMRYFKMGCFSSIFISTFILMIIEVIQFIFRVGIFDIGDVILNMLGIVIGYLLPIYFQYQYYRIKIKLGYSS